AIFTALTARMMRHLHKLFLALDALGLVTFTVIGCQIAIEMELPVTIILLSGMITGCAGGVLRDILCNDIPLLFRKEMYASVSMVTGGLYMLAIHFELNELASMLVPMGVGLLFRFLALRFNWQMPQFVYRDDWK